MRWLALAALMLAPAFAGATLPSPDLINAPQPTPTSPSVIYRCSTPGGTVSLQDEPCAPGQREERREIASFAAPPAAVATEASATASSNAATNTVDGTTGAITAADAGRPAANDPLISPRIEVSEPMPSRPLFMPPPLWRCADLNGVTRLVDRYDPQPRCVPLSVLGVDLSRAPPSAATLCRTVEDSCVELGGDAACAAWQERLDAAESALRTAFSDTMVERREARDRAKAVVDNDCRP